MNENEEMIAIDKLYPRYIELTKKHGQMNFNKQDQETLMAVTITIRYTSYCIRQSCRNATYNPSTVLPILH